MQFTYRVDILVVKRKKLLEIAKKAKLANRTLGIFCMKSLILELRRTLQSMKMLDTNIKRQTVKIYEY